MCVYLYMKCEVLKVGMYQWTKCEKIFVLYLQIFVYFYSFNNQTSSQSTFLTDFCHKFIH